MIDFDFKTYNNKYICESDFINYDNKNKVIKERLINGDLKYWLDINSYINNKELDNLKKCADDIKNKCDVFIVVGIGGSYMGSKAIIEAFSTKFEKKKTEIIFLGKNLDSNEYVEVINYIKNKEICINFISKSGVTLEPSIAFDLIMNVMKEKYSEEEIKSRVIITTDEKDGILKKFSKNYKTFAIPFNIGGRFSVFTSVGLLPLLVADINVEEILNGVKDGMNNIDISFKYAMIRNILYNKGKKIECYSIYNEKLIYLTEWLKQLFGETEGKNKKGIFPTSIINTRDLHSLGQFLQEGNDIIFETVIKIKKNKDIIVDKYNISLNTINNLVIDKVCLAHYNGYTPSSIIEIDKIDEYSIGKIMQIFMMSAIISAIYLDVDPFNQPGVLEYKKLVNNTLLNKKIAQD